MSHLHQELVDSLKNERLVALCTVIVGRKLGSKMLIWPDGQTHGDLGSPDLTRQVSQHAEVLFQQQKSERMAFDVDGDKSEVFIEVFPPPPRLIIIGAVHAAIPRITFAKELGFRNTVVDPRSAFAPPSVFPTPMSCWWNGPRKYSHHRILTKAPIWWPSATTKNWITRP